MTLDRDELHLAFRPLVHGDLERLHQWLSEPHVVPWWSDPAESIDAIEAKYGPRIDGTDPVSPWIVEVRGTPIGLIQWRPVESELDRYQGVDVPPGTAVIDVAIGDPDLLGTGLGRTVVLEFAHHVLRAAVPASTEVWIDPNPRNERAMRAFRAAGFSDTSVDLADPRHPGEVRRLMRMVWAGPTFH